LSYPTIPLNSPTWCQADRLLHEQQLGHEWVPPKEELLQQELDTFSESGTTTGKSTALESADMGQSDSGKFSATKVFESKW
jgi:hypothetical protein